MVLLLQHLVLFAELSELGAQLLNVLFLGLDLVLDFGVQVLHVGGGHTAGRGHRAILLRLIDLIKHLFALCKLFLDQTQLV